MRPFLWIVVGMLACRDGAAAQDVPMRELKVENHRVRLDLSPQVLRLQAPEDRGWSPQDGDSEGAAEAAIFPMLPIGETGAFMSAAVLAQKAKQFDDGLYAAVELAAQNGLGGFEGKAALLKALGQLLSESAAPPAGAGRDVLYAAALLGGVMPAAPPAFAPAVQEQIKAFEGNALRSKPIAFYVWTPELTKIFRQDRMLQTELKNPAELEAIARALHRAGAGRHTYEKYLALVSKLTNPLAKADLRPQLAGLDGGKWNPPPQPVAFFPPSIAPETELIKRLYGNRPIPEGFNLADEMIQRIQAGKLSLQPRPDSGWYDHQLWSFEPLVIPDQTPEAKRLVLDKSYRKLLLELFKGLITLARETHIKQLEMPLVGSAAPHEREKPKLRIRVAPELSAEPLATHYARRAQAYRFVRKVIEETFGPDALKQMHRLTADGPVSTTLDAELAELESLFHGAHGLVNRELGLPPAAALPDRNLAADIDRFRAWSRELASDLDLKQDARTMVPVFYDLQRQKTKVWLMLGWAVRPVEVEFEKAPKIEVLDAAGRKLEKNEYELGLDSLWRTVVYPVTAEVYVSQLLNRDEFRKHCDQHKTRAAILKNLK